MNHHHLLLAPSSLHARRQHYAASHLPPHLTPLLTIFTGRATASLAINIQILIALRLLRRLFSFHFLHAPSFTLSDPSLHYHHHHPSTSKLSLSLSYTTKGTSHPLPSIHNALSLSCADHTVSFLLAKQRLSLLCLYIIIPTCHLSAAPLFSPLLLSTFYFLLSPPSVFLDSFSYSILLFFFLLSLTPFARSNSCIRPSRHCLAAHPGETTQATRQRHSDPPSQATHNQQTACCISLLLSIFSSPYYFYTFSVHFSRLSKLHFTFHPSNQSHV